MEAPVIVELPAGVEITDEMRKIRIWCDNHQCQPRSFKYHLNADGTLIVVTEFIRDPDADLFKTQFHGIESEFVNLEGRLSPETIGTVCWLRLKAEEIRAEFDGFASASARETMANIARCYDTMAMHLENRLAKEAVFLSSDSSRFARFAFR